MPENWVFLIASGILVATLGTAIGGYCLFRLTEGRKRTMQSDERQAASSESPEDPLMEYLENELSASMRRSEWNIRWIFFCFGGSLTSIGFLVLLWFFLPESFGR